MPCCKKPCLGLDSHRHDWANQVLPRLSQNPRQAVPGRAPEQPKLAQRRPGAPFKKTPPRFAIARDDSLAQPRKITAPRFALHRLNSLRLNEPA